MSIVSGHSTSEWLLSNDWTDLLFVHIEGLGQPKTGTRLTPFFIRATYTCTWLLYSNQKTSWHCLWRLLLCRVACPVITYFSMLQDYYYFCAGETVKQCNRIWSREQIDQAFPNFSRVTLKNIGRSGYEVNLIQSYVYLELFMHQNTKWTECLVIVQRLSRAYNYDK